MMKTKLSRTLRCTLSTRLRKCLLATLCTVLITSAVPVQALAQVTEEVLETDQLSSTTTSSTSSITTSSTTEDTTTGTAADEYVEETDADTEETATDPDQYSSDTTESETTAGTEGTTATDTLATEDLTEIEDTSAADSTEDASSIVTDNATLLANVETLSTLEEANESDVVYISSLQITNIVDGTASFDTETVDQDSDYYYLKDGNDLNASNGRVRTFDTVTYELSYTDKVHEGISSFGSDTIYVYFEFILPLSSTEAEWDTASMLWMTEYKITETAVTYDFDGDGKDETKTCQVITGYRTLSHLDSRGQTTESSLDATIQVLAASNKTEITPVFTVWVAGNQAGDSALSDLSVVTGNTSACAEHDAIEQKTVAANGEFGTDAAYAVEVTCAPRYNIQIKASPTSYDSIDTYDFTTGNGYALDTTAGNSVYGFVSSYGVTIQLYNHSGCGLKGVEIPTGDITFEIELSTVFVDENGKKYNVSGSYDPLVYSWGPNTNSSYDERDLSMFTAALAISAAPGNFGMTALGSLDCYDGGTWSATKENNTISVTVSGYDILYPLFPNGNSGESATASTTYFDLSQGVESIEIGCFSAGKFFILTPYYSSTNEYIKDEYGDGSFETTLTVTNVNFDIDKEGTRTAGETTESNVPNDNSVTSTISLPESYTASEAWRTQWTYPTTPNASVTADVLGRYSNAPGSWGENGQDALALGSDLAICVAVINDENTNSDNRLYAADLLCKFDGSAVTLTGGVHEYGIEDYGYTLTILYATKANGQNWSNDQEMNETKIEDLVYHETLAEAQEAGVVVAYLAEIRPVDNDPDNITKLYQGSRLFVSVGATVNTDKALVGNVYQCVMEGRIWRADTWNTAADELGVAPSGVAVIPSMAGSGGTTTVTLPNASVDYHPTDYVKTEYATDGTATDSTEYSKGDSLLIPEATPSISKSVTSGTTYSVDNGELTVDYTLEPSFESISYDEPYETTLTTLTITDTLPVGMSYVSGSASVDGNSAGAEPSVTPNTDGTTTLTWVFTDVNTLDDMSQYTITYSAEIDPTSVLNRDVLTNTATITYDGTIDATRTDDDLRAFSTSVGNMSTASISISKMSTFTFYKKADYSVYDPGDEITYTLHLSSAITRLNDAVILDILPFSGDSRGSDFTGSLTVSSVQLTDATGWSCYYTTDDSSTINASNYTTATDIANDTAISWTPATVNTDGSVTGIAADATAIAWVGPSTGGSTDFEATVTLQTSTDMSAGDTIINSMYHNGNEAHASAYIANRSITGKVWLDANEDGQQDASESTLEGITVTLLDENNEPVTATNGDEVSLVTEVAGKNQATEYTITTSAGNETTIRATATADGSYEFSGLPAGTYTVRFSSSDSVDLTKFVASPQNVGDDYTDSDAVGYYLDGTEASNTSTSTNKLQYTYIDEDIELPEAEDLSVASYVSRFNDSGLYYKPGNLTVTKTVTGDNPDTSQEFSFTVTLGDELTGTYGDMYFEEGVATFTLSHGQSVAATGLPAGVTYKVEGTAVAGYTTTVSVDGGQATTSSTAEGSIPIDDTTTVEFTNYRGAGSLTVSTTTTTDGSLPKTGDTTNPLLSQYAAIACGVSVLAIALGLVLRRRNVS